MSLLDAFSKGQDIVNKYREGRLPFGGKQLTGAAGQIAGLESIKQIYGENSPQYQMAQQSFGLQGQSRQSQVDYQNFLMGHPERFLTTRGKEIIEQGNVGGGNKPTGQPWKPGETHDTAENQADAYGLKLNKEATDTDTRKRNLFATNIEKTLDQINPDDLVRYAGAINSVSKLANGIAAPFGYESKNYDNYSVASKAADFLATQVRQFYGDSIQPAMIKRLENLTNPAFWGNNPKLAKMEFDQTKKLLKIEMKTYRNAMKSKKVYQGQDESNDPLGIR